MAEIRIGAEQFRRQLTDLLNRVSYGDDHVVVERHGTAMAALISFEIYQALLAADIPQKLTKRSETEASTADLAAEIEAILQDRGLTYQSSAAITQHEQLPMVQEQATSYYVQPSTFTLEEVAMYLKLPVDAVAKGAAQGEIPGRRVNNTWRFLKTAIDNWLRNVDGRQVLLQQAGAFADDDLLAELRRQIYQERGRPEAEEPDNEDAA